MSVMYDCFCVYGNSGRETLTQHNIAVTQNTDGGSALVLLPWSTYLHRWLYPALPLCVCVCMCVCSCVVHFLQVERRTLAAVEYSGVCLFLVSEFLLVPVSLCYQIEAGILLIDPILVPGGVVRGSEMVVLWCVLVLSRKGVLSCPYREHQDSIKAVWESGLRLQSWPLRLNMLNL